jgi:hypothetical protein
MRLFPRVGTRHSSSALSYQSAAVAAIRFCTAVQNPFETVTNRRKTVNIESYDASLRCPAVPQTADLSGFFAHFHANRLRVF